VFSAVAERKWRMKQFGWQAFITMYKNKNKTEMQKGSTTKATKLSNTNT